MLVRILGTTKHEYLTLANSCFTSNQPPSLLSSGNEATPNYRSDHRPPAINQSYISNFERHLYLIERERLYFSGMINNNSLFTKKKCRSTNNAHMPHEFQIEIHFGSKLYNLTLHNPSKHGGGGQSSSSVGKSRFLQN